MCPGGLAASSVPMCAVGSGHMHATHTRPDTALEQQSHRGESELSFPPPRPAPGAEASLCSAVLEKEITEQIAIKGGKGGERDRGPKMQLD